jgi:peptide/nickel transport system ATP-binding protein
MSKVVLQTQDLQGYYRGTFGIIHAVDGVSLTVYNDDILGLAGESGCGKSTFLKLITGTPGPLLHYEGGKIEVEGRDIYNIPTEELRKEIKCNILSYIPQSALNALNPTVRLKEFVRDMLRERAGRKCSADEAREILADHFKMLNLDKHVLDLYPHELSGGMRQRAVIAISTYSNPSLLLTDEPTSSLDVSSQKQMVEMLIHLYRTRTIKSMIISSHDVSMLRQICNRFAIMYAGKIVEEGGTEDVVNSPLHPYTKLLLTSLLPLEKWIKHEKLKSAGGIPPDLRNPPPGCRFHLRCSQCTDICMSEMPPTVEKNGRILSCWLYS